MTLLLNVSKTKDMYIDFTESAAAPQNTVIKGQSVDMVTTYKYLGTIIDNRLKFDANTEELCKRGQQRLFCLRKLAKFQIDKTLLTMFYSAFIESVISFSIICWFGNLDVKEKNALDKIVRIASKVVGIQFRSLNVVYNSQMVNKARSIAGDASHPLNREYRLLPSGVRYDATRAIKKRFKSFVPASIRMLNTLTKR